MALPCASSLKIFPLSSFSHCFPPQNDFTFFSSSPSPYVPKTHSEKPSKLIKNSFNSSSRLSYRFSAVEDHYDDDDDDTSDNCSFDEAVALFNDREYYKCHDYLEALWNMAQEPTRTLIHGILQCAVGFHHLFNQVGTSFVGFALLIYWFSLFTSLFSNFGYGVLFWWFVVN